MGVQPTTPQVITARVFVDFWNYELSMHDVDINFKTDWKAIGQTLAGAAVSLVSSQAQLGYQGMNVYTSYNPANPKDNSFKAWATNVLDTFPGVHVSLAERQKKRSGPKCPSCHTMFGTCPSCSADMRGTEEKGVDTKMVTDMMSLAWASNYQVAVLLSADRDFVPVADFLQTKGIKVIHGAFPPKGAFLGQKCWGKLDVPSLRSGFQRL